MNQAIFTMVPGARRHQDSKPLANVTSHEQVAFGPWPSPFSRYARVP
jgi:hypothetical protein